MTKPPAFVPQSVPLKSRAFTLVELLVVIGIIALLISILLPTLNKARKAARTIKCEAALREIGNAFALYSGQGNGWWPPAKLTADPSTTGYYVNGFNYTSAVSAYWFNFIGKYLTSYQVGYAAGTNLSQTSGARNSLLWGCPEWPGYYGGTTVGPDGIYAEQPGYGMNLYPTFTSTYPTVIGNAAAFGNAQAVVITGWGNPANQAGIWLKSTQYSRPSERMLICDSAYWGFQAEYVSVTDAKLLPGMPVLQNNTAPTFQATTWADWYRHAPNYPKVTNTFQDNINGPVYNIRGGPAAYNILYCDGHVVTTHDPADSFRSSRMRYPG